MLALALVLSLWNGPVAGETTTPLVPNDVGHWINLDHRTGKLAPEMAGNPHAIRTVLVVERSLVKIDAYLSESRQTSGCHQLILPYARIVVEPYAVTDENGDVVLTNRKVRKEDQLAVGVCSTIEQRLVFWETAGALMILGRPRNDFGTFPRTYYALFQIPADERARWSERSERLVARGKVPKPPKVKTLYMPLGDDPVVQLDDPMVSAFGAEFGLPEITAGRLASKQPTEGDPPQEPKRHDR